MAPSLRTLAALTAALLLAPLALAHEGETGPATVNGDFSFGENEARLAKGAAKSVGYFTEADGRFTSRGLAFSPAECGGGGDCVANLTVGKGESPAIGVLRLPGGAALDVAGGTATLESGSALVTLLALEPGFGRIDAHRATRVALTLPEGGSARAVGAGILELSGGSTPILLGTADGALAVSGRDVDLELPANGTAWLLGDVSEGFGVVPAANVTTLLTTGRFGGFVAVATVKNATHATVADLGGAVLDVELESDRLHATVDPAGRTSIFQFRLDASITEEALADTLVLVDGKVAAVARDATELWNGAEPVPGTAFVSEGTIAVAVQGDGTHDVEILIPPHAEVERRLGNPEVKATGKPATVNVGNFSASTANSLTGRYVQFNLTKAGGDAVLADFGYPGRATPMFESVRIAGAGDAALIVDEGSPGYRGSTARLDSTLLLARAYDAPPAWLLVEARRAIAITFEAGPGVALGLSTTEMRATVNDVHAHVFRSAARPGGVSTLDASLDAAAGTVTVRLAAGDRLVVAVHPAAGTNVADFHGIVDLLRNGQVEGLREAAYDEDLGESSHWVGFAGAPRLVRYEDGVAQVKLRAAATGGRVAVLDLTPAMMRSYDPAVFTVNYDGANLASSKASLDVRTLKATPAALTSTAESGRLLVWLPDAEEHTVTLSQAQTTVADDPGRALIITLLGVCALGVVAAWWVAKRYEAD